MAIQLSSSYLRRSYQLLAKVNPKDEMSLEEAFDRASNIIYEWVKIKYSNIFPHIPFSKRTLDFKKDGNELGIIFEPDEGRFILRASHPDVNVAGRIWITDVQLQKKEDSYWLAVRLSTSSLQNCTEDVPFSCPTFVWYILDCIGLSDIVKMSRKYTRLVSNEAVDNFIDFLQNPDRQLPVILLTPCNSVVDALWGRYMLNAEDLSQDLSAVAHVFLITHEQNDYFIETVGKKWGAFDGAIRTYYPGVSFDNDDYYRHPLLTRQNFSLPEVEESKDPSFCMHKIEAHVKNYALSRRILWEEKGFLFYLAEHQNRLQIQREQTSNSKRELVDSYEEQLNQLKTQQEEYLALATSYAEDFEKAQSDIDRQQQQIRQLKAKINALQYQIDTSESIEKITIPEDGTYTEIGDWISEYFPDRLVLTARAERSLKKAEYENPQLVYKCLKLLATSYYEYRTSIIQYENFMDRCKEIDPGLEERGSITDVSAGMQGDTYYVMYQGKKRKLERHLTKGSSKDRRYCMRIYFFWDEDNQVVVIGDLPHHLDTTAT